MDHLIKSGYDQKLKTFALVRSLTLTTPYFSIILRGEHQARPDVEKEDPRII
jgi:hypothetical protein